MHLTTWNILFELFKSNLLNDSTYPNATYETDKLVQNVAYDGEKVSVTYLDTKSINARVLRANLIIAANGGHSTVRKLFISDIISKYVEYIT